MALKNVKQTIVLKYKITCVSNAFMDFLSYQISVSQITVNRLWRILDFAKSVWMDFISIYQPWHAQGKNACNKIKILVKNVKTAILLMSTITLKQEGCAFRLTAKWSNFLKEMKVISISALWLLNAKNVKTISFLCQIKNVWLKIAIK